MSRGSDKLQIIRNIYHSEYGEDISMDKDLDIIEKELKEKETFEELVNMDLDLFMKAVDIKGLIEDYQKFKQALEIIKNKRVDVDLLTQSVCAMQYNEEIENHFFKKRLTREEFDFLKEVLL